jgi:DNA-binding MarR family transcriptional regulator
MRIATLDIEANEETASAETNWPAVAAWMRLARVYHKIDRRSSEAFRTHELTVAQFDVLAQVGSRPGCTQQELADRLLVTKGNVAQVLDRMEMRGLIERRKAGQGRGNLLNLTERGEALRGVAVPEQEARITRLLAGLSPDDLHHLNRMLRTLDRTLASSHEENTDV